MYGVIIRQGDQWRYYDLPWYTNAWYSFPPDLWLDDFDGDGQQEAAVQLAAGHGTGVSVKNLYLFEPDTLEYTVPEFDTLFTAFQTSYDETAQTVTLTNRSTAWTLTSWTISLANSEWSNPFTGIYAGNIVSFTRNGPALQAHFGLDFSGIGYLADLTADVVWQYGSYTLSHLALSLTEG